MKLFSFGCYYAVQYSQIGCVLYSTCKYIIKVFFMNDIFPLCFLGSDRILLYSPLVADSRSMWIFMGHVFFLYAQPKQNPNPKQNKSIYIYILCSFLQQGQCSLWTSSVAIFDRVEATNIKVAFYTIYYIYYYYKLTYNIYIICMFLFVWASGFDANMTCMYIYACIQYNAGSLADDIYVRISGAHSPTVTFPLTAFQHKQPDTFLGGECFLHEKNKKNSRGTWQGRQVCPQFALRVGIMKLIFCLLLCRIHLLF